MSGINTWRECAKAWRDEYLRVTRNTDIGDAGSTVRAESAFRHLAETDPEGQAIYEAWVVIANASDWGLRTPELRNEWVEAAERWRDTYLHGVAGRER